MASRVLSVPHSVGVSKNNALSKMPFHKRHKITNCHKKQNYCHLVHKMNSKHNSSRSMGLRTYPIWYRKSSKQDKSSIMKAIKILGCQFYPMLDNYEVHVRFTVRLKLAVSEPKVLFATQIYCAASSGST